MADITIHYKVIPGSHPSSPMIVLEATFDLYKDKAKCLVMQEGKVFKWRVSKQVLEAAPVVAFKAVFPFPTALNATIHKGIKGLESGSIWDITTHALGLLLGVVDPIFRDYSINEIDTSTIFRSRKVCQDPAMISQSRKSLGELIELTKRYGRDELEDEDRGIWEFCNRVYLAITEDEWAAIRKELAEG